MTHNISSACTACGACYDECPTEAVIPGSPVYRIDPDHCDDCESCTDVCAAGAIVAD